MATTMVCGQSALATRAISTRSVRPRTCLPIIYRAAPVAKGRSRGVLVRATDSKVEVDFDELLNDLAKKFEDAPNKPAIIGWSVAAVSAVFVAEWLIHLPLLNALLGFPVQLVGLFSLPLLGVRYFVDDKDVVGEIKEATENVIKKLPGL